MRIGGRSLNFYGQKVLFMGAHPDDIEIGCGALLSHITHQCSECDIRCVTLSDNQKNPKLKNLVQEHYRSMEVLGVPKEKVILGTFETRNFPRDRQEILEYLYGLNHTFEPDIVFAHSPADIHQDHGVVTTESLRAFRGKTVLGFDVLRSSYGFFPHFLMEVDEQDVECKVRALAQYETYRDVYYFNSDITRSTLVRHGALAEMPYAEGFDILRIVGNFQNGS
jgi:LmbE family N-acetylglucosaminyl deacetylase